MERGEGRSEEVQRGEGRKGRCRGEEGWEGTWGEGEIELMVTPSIDQ